MPPDQSNLPEGVSRWAQPRGPGGRREMILAATSDSDGPFYVREDQVSAIIEQARQEEREKVREALAKATARASIHTREAGQVLPVESIEIALDLLDSAHGDGDAA